MEPLFTLKPVNPDEVILRHLRSFYQLNPVGVSMSTQQELMEMALAYRKVGELYQSVTADGKIDFQDANAENINRLIELAPMVVEAIRVENGFDLHSLGRTEARDVLAHLVETTFLFLKLTPTGTAPATYKELREIVDLSQAIVSLFEKMTEDGAITWTDAVTNLGSLIDITKAVQIAAKIDGTINLAELTSAEAASLIADLVECVFAVIAAAKKLQ